MARIIIAPPNSGGPELEVDQDRFDAGFFHGYVYVRDASPQPSSEVSAEEARFAGLVSGGTVLPAALRAAYVAKGAERFNVKDYGAIGNGNATTGAGTDDTAAINAAITACYNAGGGTVIFPRATYVVKRKSAGSQAGGGIALRAGVNLQGQGATLVLQDNCDFIWAVSTQGQTTTVTGDTLATDTSLTVSSSSGFNVGDRVIVKLGQASYDAFEPDFWVNAIVTAVPNSTHITIDRPVGYAQTAGSVSAGNRQVIQLTEFLQGNVIDGFTLIDPRTGSASAERGVYVSYAQNITVRNIIADHPGAGAVVTQYADGLTLDNIRVRKSMRQGAQASKGRCFGFAETRNVIGTNLYGENFEGAFCFIEARSEGIVLTNVRVENNFTGRDNTNANPVFASEGGASATVNGLFMGGVACALHTSDQREWSFTDPVFHQNGVTQIDSARVVAGRMMLGLVRYDAPRSYSRTFRLLPSANISIPLPSGLLRRLRLRVSTTTGITYSYVNASGTGGGTTGPLHGSFVAGQMVDLSDVQGATGIGSTYPASGTANKALVITTDGTVPAGAWASVEAEVFGLPGANDGARGVHAPFDYIGLESAPTVTGAKGSNAALGSLVTALANLGLIVDSTSA